MRRAGPAALAQPLSLYVHIPFCESLCYYCACNKIITKHKSKAATYLRYLSREGMMEAVDEATPKSAGGPKLRVIGEGYCDACFTGNYPVQFTPGEMSSLRRVIN